jgi:glycosyltransferase involved in cell wall biosynthesis
MNVSVALCTCEGEKYIEEQLLSIITQTVKPNEIILCDDCSSDNTLEIVQKIKLKNPDCHIEIFQNEKRIGAKHNFAMAISKCKAEMIFLSDQDDVWHPHKIEEFLIYFKNNKDIKVLFSNAELIDGTGKLLHKKTLFDILNFDSQAHDLFYRNFFLELENNQNRVTGATMAFYRSYIFEKKIVPFINGAIWHDEIIAVNATLDECIGFIDQCLLKYRIHPTQHVGLEFNRAGNDNNNNVWLYKPLNKYYYSLRDDFKTHKKLLFFHKRERRVNSLLGLIMILINCKEYEIFFDQYAKFAVKSDLRKNINFLCNKLLCFWKGSVK